MSWSVGPLVKMVQLRYISAYTHACSVAQSCPTLCNPVDCSPPGSSVHGILQAKITRVGCGFLLRLIPPMEQKQASPPSSTSSSLTTRHLFSEVVVVEEGQRLFPQAPGDTCGRWCHLEPVTLAPCPAWHHGFGDEYKIMVSSQAPESPCARKQSPVTCPSEVVKLHTKGPTLRPSRLPTTQICSVCLISVLWGKSSGSGDRRPLSTALL